MQSSENQSTLLLLLYELTLVLNVALQAIESLWVYLGFHTAA